MDNNTNWINLAFLIIFVGVILWFSMTYSNNLKFWYKEKQEMQLEIDNLKRQNVALFEENMKLKNRNKVYNDINFNLITSLIE